MMVCCLFSDENECLREPSPCDINAMCTNSRGNYTCDCNRGYSGDGVTCDSKYLQSVNRSVLI